jgi:hypothetical protein
MLQGMGAHRALEERRTGVGVGVVHAERRQPGGRTRGEVASEAPGIGQRFPWLHAIGVGASFIVGAVFLGVLFVAVLVVPLSVLPAPT